MAIKAGMKNFLSADLYGLTAEEYSLGRSNVEVVKELILAGITVIQYREKDKKSRQMFQECQAIRTLTEQANVTFIINDYIDLALLVGADGIHVGQDDVPVDAIRRLVGPEMVIGLSTHSPQQAQAAVLSGVVDYIGVGPIFATKTKKDVCQAVGMEYLQHVVEYIDLPFVAIGGIKEHNIAAVRRGGAKTIALVTEIVGAANIPQKVLDIRTALANV